MTVGQICSNIENVLQVTFRPNAEPDPDAGTFSALRSQCLAALNHVRKEAERGHDFHAAEETVIVGVDPDTGGSLVGVPLWTPTGPSGVDSVDVKSIQSAWHTNSTFDQTRAVLVETKKDVAAREKELLEVHSVGRDSLERYPPDGWSSVSVREMAYLQKDRIYLYPRPEVTTNLILDVWRWFDDYTDDEDEDFFTKHGYDYLFWAGLVEINYMIQTFVPRTEGSLSPPVREKQAAWESLKAYDDFIVYGGQQPMLR